MTRVHLSIFVVLCLLPTLIQAQEHKIYVTTDAEGKVVYTDRASDDAVEVEMEEPVIYTPINTDPGRTNIQRDEIENRPDYTQLAITSPNHDESIRSNAGDLSVVFTIFPGLRSNHSIQLLMDGTVKHTTKTLAPIPLKNVDRGQHLFRLQVVEDASKKVVYSSASVSATLMRHSILHIQFSSPPVRP